MKREQVLKIFFPILLLAAVVLMSYLLFRLKFGPARPETPTGATISEADALRSLTPPSEGSDIISASKETQALKSLSATPLKSKKVPAAELNKALQSLSPQ